MIYIVCGPTGSGKTEVGKKLSDFYHAPIINADAFQIYQDMDIGTAKISQDDPYYKKHYLLDKPKPSRIEDNSYFLDPASEEVHEFLIALHEICLYFGASK